MKKFIVISMAILATISSVVAQNLVSNGTFEDWTYVHKNIAGEDSLAMPDNWIRGAGAMGVNYFQANDTERGKVLRLVDADGATVTARRFSSNNINVLESGTYRVSFWVKGNVGLRAVVLVKGTGAPATNAQSATNHYTTITGFVSGTANLSSWTKVTTDITVPSTATFGDDYRLHVSWSISTGTAPRPACDFMIDDISLAKLSDEGLSNITITPYLYTPTAGTPNYSLGGFSSDILDYVYTTSFLEVPVVEGTAARTGSTVNVIQAVSLTGALADRKATVIVTTNTSKTTVYTVEFRKHPGFISGIPWDVRSNNVDWAQITGLYSRDAVNNGKIPVFGNTAFRCNTTSANGFFATTPVLENGASILSFYLRNNDIAGDDTQIVIQKSDDNNTEWREVFRVTPNTSDYSTVWKEVKVTVNDNSPGLKLKFVFEKNIETSGKVYLDDVEILPFGATATENIRSSDIQVYGFNNQLYIQSAESVKYTVYTINGMKISEGISSEMKPLTLKKGVYVVKAGNESFKVIL